MQSPLFGSAHEVFSFSCRYSQNLSEQPAEKCHVWGPSPPSFPCGDRGIAGIEGQRSGDAGKRGRAEALPGGAMCSVAGVVSVLREETSMCL